MRGHSQVSIRSMGPGIGIFVISSLGEPVFWGFPTKAEHYEKRLP